MTCQELTTLGSRVLDSLAIHEALVSHLTAAVPTGLRNAAADSRLLAQIADSESLAFTPLLNEKTEA